MYARTVTFTFTSDRSVRSAKFEACFRAPPRIDSKDSPYHLDGAHRHVIEGLRPNSHVLEIGCGGAQMRAFFASRGHHYVGSDFSNDPLRWSETDLQFAGGPDVFCDAHFLPFADHQFDMVYSAAVTEHVACPYLVVQEAFRCLKPGGFYLGNVAFLEPWHGDSYFHMTPLGVYEILIQGGFNPLHIWPGHGYHGFGSIMRMSSTTTKKLSFIGSGINAVYRLNASLRNIVRPKPRIEDDARVAGGIDWIAQRP